jgi:pyridoxamine 5'-phosphate oxidase
MRTSRVDREELDRRYAELAAELGESDPERPEHWGGYMLRPDEIEFWQGRDSRMHDRLVYRRGPEGWEVQRLAP